MPYKDKEKANANKRKNNKLHPELARERQRRYRAEHPEQIKAARRDYYWRHRDRMIDLSRKSHVKHREARLLYHKQYNRELKELVIKTYGGRCTCCGERELDFLCIDHLNGGGTQHRFKVGLGSRFYHWLKKQGFPPDYQVLCYNCNMGKESPDGCPHQRRKVE